MTTKKKAQKSKGSKKEEADIQEGKAVPRNDLAGRTLAVAFPDDTTREYARCGEGVSGTVIDAFSDLSNELGIYPMHPEIIAVALPVVLREAAASDSPAIARLLRRLKTAVRKAEKGSDQ